MHARYHLHAHTHKHTRTNTLAQTCAQSYCPFLNDINYPMFLEIYCNNAMVYLRHNSVRNSRARRSYSKLVLVATQNLFGQQIARKSCYSSPS